MRVAPRGATLLEVLVAAGLASGVLLIAGTLYVAVLSTERTTRELVGSTPGVGLSDVLQDLLSCRGTPVLRASSGESEGGPVFRWWRQAVCVRAYVLDVQSAGAGAYVLRFRSAADVGSLRMLWSLAEALAGPEGPEGWVQVRTVDGCVCRADFGTPTATPVDLVVQPCEACVPTPGPVEATPTAPDRPEVWAQVVVVPPGGRRPAGAPPEVSPQGLSLIFLAGVGGRSAEAFPRSGVRWLSPYIHLPSPTVDAAITRTAWGSPYRTGEVGASDVLMEDLDGDGDGELELDEAPARRLVPASAVEGWTLWTTGFGRLRRSVPVRCGPLTIPVGDTRACRSDAFGPL
ncbi:MAG: hypothetical protein NZ742_03775 [Acidobacteria bacterium]|nr:hypothetical protein [Acidobacteriota bacterium]